MPDNTMVKRTKRQTMVDKISHRNPKIEQQESTKNRDNSDAAGGYAVSASLVEHVVLKILLLVI
jgi:hypothetical protein